MRVLLFLLLAALFSGCQKSDSEIVAARQWKYGEGYRIGDWIEFSEDKNKGLFVSNDTIYKNGTPEAVIDALDYNFDHYVLTIHSLDNKQSGTYIDKGSAE